MALSDTTNTDEAQPKLMEAQSKSMEAQPPQEIGGVRFSFVRRIPDVSRNRSISILVDMDNTICDFDAEIVRRFSERFVVWYSAGDWFERA